MPALIDQQPCQLLLTSLMAAIAGEEERQKVRVRRGKVQQVALHIYTKHSLHTAHPTAHTAQCTLYTEH